MIYGYLEFDRRHNSFPSDLRNQMIWRTVPFLPLWSSAWCMAWATAIAPLVTKQSKPSVGYPILMNVYFIAGFFALYAAMIPLAIILNNHYNVLWDLYLQLDEALGAAAASFDQGVIPDVGALEGYKQQVADIFPSIIADWRRFWLVLTGFVAVLLVVRPPPSALDPLTDAERRRRSLLHVYLSSCSSGVCCIRSRRGS